MNALTIVSTQTDGTDQYIPSQDTTKQEPKGWFFTFGTNHYSGSNPLSHRYVVIPIVNYAEARERMVKYCGSIWAFQYPLSELKHQAHKFNLSPIGLSDIANNGGVKRFS